MTVIIQIGNGDNKLTQREWSGFVKDVDQLTKARASKTYFFGTSHGDEPWQNACWVVELPPDQLESLKEELSASRQRFRQDALAFTCGTTEFI